MTSSITLYKRPRAHLLADYPLNIHEQQQGTWAYAFQIKGPRQKDHYSTLAVFNSLKAAYDFTDSFPSVPGCTVRIMSDDKRIIHRQRYQFKECSFSVGSLAWMLYQSTDIVQTINNNKKQQQQQQQQKVKLPKFSIRNIANKSLKSFTEEAKYLFGFSY